MASTDERQAQNVFLQLKAVCVPLLGSTLLSPTSIPRVSELLDHLSNILVNLKRSDTSLTSNLISYVFFPLSTLLRRNDASNIPDRILEKVLVIMGILCSQWWWDCDLAVWEQIFMLCMAIIGGMDTKGKGRTRDDETKEAAGRCLLALLRDPEGNSDIPPTFSPRAQSRLNVFQEHVRTPKFLPNLGQVIDALLSAADTPHLPLQSASLQALALIIDIYASDDLVPSVLPGIVSSMAKISLGVSTARGWAKGDIVASSLGVMQCAVIRAINDDICTREGVIRRVVDLEDLAQSEPKPNHQVKDDRPFIIPRTPSWLRGTTSQLLIALNSLTPLVSHPTPSALLGLSKFSMALLSATPTTLADAQPLLLHWLLSLSNSDIPSVSEEARASLLSLLASPSIVQHPLQQTLLRTANDNLLALPRLLSIHADAKVIHAAGIIEAICRLAFPSEELSGGFKLISIGIGKLLGPSGGIEKWGWSLLSVLELTEPHVILSGANSAQLMLESNQDAPSWVPFPHVEFRSMSSNNAKNALERMLRALGQASGDGCLFAVEWFANVGRSGVTGTTIAATWCACRLLEGVIGTSLDREIVSDKSLARRSKRLLKLARALARSIAELWDESNQEEQAEPAAQIHHDFDDHMLVQHVTGVHSIPDTLKLIHPSTAKRTTTRVRHGLHRALLLQLLATSASILRAQFISLFIYALYPVLRSLVSSDAYLSSTALATLHHITTVTSYASPGNLLLSNFDYALDAVSRRLSRRWLDVEATKVLALIIRLVGSDVVERAGDVVEECFDRLDEFHGYRIIVEGLINVLGDVINVIREDAHDSLSGIPIPSQEADDEVADTKSMDNFFLWFSHRRKQEGISDQTNYGRAPQEAWGNGASDNNEDQPTQDEFNADPPATPLQALAKQIVSRSLYFLTHGSPVVRARILSLLASSVAVLPEPALLPSIHRAWPFILNRLADPEPYIVSAAASLVEELAVHTGSFMFRRVWDDIWPKFHALLRSLDLADTANALARRGPGAVGTESAYTHSHRTYRAVIKTMTAAVRGIRLQETSLWQLLLDIRRFLHKEAHEELQTCARNLYIEVAKKNLDVVWLVLASTMGNNCVTMQFLIAQQWDIRANVAIIFQELEQAQNVGEIRPSDHH